MNRIGTNADTKLRTRKSSGLSATSFKKGGIQMTDNRIKVFVAAAGEIHDDELVLSKRRRDFERIGDGVRGFERRNDTLGHREQLECGERFLVRGMGIQDSPLVVEVRMLGADARIVETRRNAVRILYLAISVLQHIGRRSVKHADAAAFETRRMLSRRDAFTARFNADHPDLLVCEEFREQSERVAAAADARDEHPGQ